MESGSTETMLVTGRVRGVSAAVRCCADCLKHVLYCLFWREQLLKLALVICHIWIYLFLDLAYLGH